MFKVLRNGIFGRYIVAEKHIRAGEIIFTEGPILIIPFYDGQRCTNCYRLTNIKCRKCKALPLCVNCSSHNDFDCDFLAKFNQIQLNILTTNLAAYGIIKCLLLNENPRTKKVFKELMHLESHQEARRGSDIWLDNAKCIVEPILSSPGIASCFKETKHIDEELIQQICGIIDVNCFEIRAHDEGSLRAIFPNASLLAHNCVANTSIAITDDNQMRIFAKHDIGKGDMLTYCYTNPLLGTDERRRLLKIGKYFHCKCQRCEDPTELGSYMSSLLCTKCPKRAMIYLNNTWKCEQCNFTMKTEAVESVLKRAKEEILRAENDIKEYEKLIMKYSTIFHKNHYIIIDLKQSVAAILRSYIMNPTLRPGKLVLERKMILCKEILTVLEIVQPGLSRLKAIAQYEMFTSFAELSRLRYHENEVTEFELLELLREAENVLREAIKILLYEPVNSPEGRLCKNMLKELRDLQNDMRLLSQ